mgnify:FL=1|jgi:hypothetical protein
MAEAAGSHVPSKEFQAQLKKLGLNVAMNEHDSNKYVPDDEGIDKAMQRSGNMLNS